MPPALKAASATSKLKATLNELSISPDAESPPPEPEVQPRAIKKKNKHAAKQQPPSTTPPENTQHVNIIKEESPPPPPVRSETLLSIPRSFPPPRACSPPPDDPDDLPATEKVSDQHTPPNDDDRWLQDAIYGRSPPVEPVNPYGLRAATPAQPGFSTRGGFNSRSPPVSPPQRHSRPVSYGGGVPPVPHYPRMSTSPYSRPASTYGSPPAPHMPQPHFYHAQDVDLGLPRGANPQFNEEPTLVKYTRLPSIRGGLRQGVILGFEGRLSIVSVEQGKTEELGGITGFSGVVVDAILLHHSSGRNEPNEKGPLIAVVIHGPVEIEHVPVDVARDGTIGSNQRPASAAGNGYATRVDVFSLRDGIPVASLLQTPTVYPQPVMRGMSPSPPEPSGSFGLYESEDFLVVASGISGEVFVFAIFDDESVFECIGKFWTTIQPLILRRDSSHHRLSDADVSPADIGRGAKTSERAIIDLKGRWLAICPASLPSSPSVGASIGQSVVVRRSNGLETTSAPARPSITCEVDSPDAESLFGKVARGVAQEFVKGAKWLGDTGLQTWQSYWNKGQSPPTLPSQQSYNPAAYPVQQGPNVFPPTHAEMTRNSKESELVSVYDLRAIQQSKRAAEELRPIATFQPPSGCSYVSFSPNGLHLLTAGRQGLVQYVWDLMQIKNCRSSNVATDDDRTRSQTRVRQVARFERLSASMIVDVVWDGLVGSRIAILTKNNTVHLFDLPQSALRWPPPRIARISKPVAAKSTEIASTTIQRDTPGASGFFASAMNIANKAQPMVAVWRGRAPSMSGGIAEIGTTGIGIASATGAKGGKAVAAGLSKSLSAASETVHNIRHANDSRLHLKSTTVFTSGKIFWSKRQRISVLCVIDSGSVQFRYVRKSKAQDKRQKETVSVFDAKKPTIVKLPKSLELRNNPTEIDEAQIAEAHSGFWTPSLDPIQKTSPHPLSLAEIETNAPYQPFHTDRRVTISVYADDIRKGDGQQAVAVASLSVKPRRETAISDTASSWVFGDDIPTVRISTKKGHFVDEENAYSNSIIYRETTITSSTIGDEDMEQIVSTTRRSKKQKTITSQHDTASDAQKDDFEFEDDCEVLDFASDRV